MEWKINPFEQKEMVKHREREGLSSFLCDNQCDHLKGKPQKTWFERLIASNILPYINKYIQSIGTVHAIEIISMLLYFINVNNRAVYVKCVQLHMHENTINFSSNRGYFMVKWDPSVLFHLQVIRKIKL